MGALWGGVPRIASLIGGLIKLRKRNLQRNSWIFKSDSCFDSALFTLDTGPSHQHLKGLWNLSAKQWKATYDANHKG